MKELIKLDKFEDECLKEKQITKAPGAIKIKTETDKNNKVKLLLSNSDYFLKGAENVLETSTPSLVFIAGFYAMEHRSNALIAENGFDIKEHKCSEIFLSKLGFKDLAKQLSNAETQRRNHYNMNLDETGNKRAKEFFDKIVKPFVEEIDRLIEE